MVTGAAGFIGAAAIRALLERGDEVIALVQPGSSFRRLNGLAVTAVWLDLEDRSAVERALAEFRPECILHAAWYADPKDYLTSPMALVSLRLTTDLVQVAVKVGCRRFVGVGTCLEYARSDRPRREDGPCEPRTLYASSKLSAWLLSRSLVTGSNTSLAWARLFYPYGPNENQGRLLSGLVATLKAGQPFPMTAGVQVRDYLHVDDAGSALSLLCNSAADGVVNVASGRPTTLRDFAMTAAGLLDKQSMVRLGELPMRPDEEMFVVADVARLRGLGFEPR